jgi:hypothetical protein
MKPNTTDPDARGVNPRELERSIAGKAVSSFPGRFVTGAGITPKQLAKAERRRAATAPV